MVELEVREHPPYNFFKKREPTPEGFNRDNWEALQCYPEFADVLHFYGVSKDHYKEKDGVLRLVNGGTAITALQDISIKVSDETSDDLVTFDKSSNTINIPSYRPPAVENFRINHRKVVREIADMFECSSDEVTEKTLLAYSFANAIGSAIQTIAQPDLEPREDIEREIAFSYLRQNRSKFIDLPVYLPKDDSPEELDKERTGWELFQKQLAKYFPYVENSDEYSLVRNAYFCAYTAHKEFNKPRKNGDPYFMHPRDVAILILQAGITDADTIAAALLHDVQEDTLQIVDHTLEHAFEHFFDISLSEYDEDFTSDNDFDLEAYSSIQNDYMEIDDSLKSPGITRYERLRVMFNREVADLVQLVTQEEDTHSKKDWVERVELDYRRVISSLIRSRKYTRDELDAMTLIEIAEAKYKEEIDDNYLDQFKDAHEERKHKVFPIKKGDNIHNLDTLDSVDIRKQVRKVKQIEQFIKIYRKRLRFEEDVEDDTRQMFETARVLLLNKILLQIEIRKLFFKAQGETY